MGMHTPGPWAITNSKAFLNQWGVGKDLFSSAVRVGDQAIAIVARDGMTAEQSDTNAQLLATAPKLLGALAEMVAWHAKRSPTDFANGPLPRDQQHPEVQAAMDAIAEATGATP